MTNFGFPPYVGNAPFLFISYKSEESYIVAEYARTLYNSNIPVYYDAALRPGQDWENELLTTITKPNCAGVILMMSTRALQSVHIRDEIRAAHRSGKPILAVYLEAITDIDMSMRAYIENIQGIKLWQIPDAMGRHTAVFNGALNLIQGNLTSSTVRNDATQLYDNAKVYINNYRVSGNPKDLERAREEYKKITESYASDYRGWMGLIECECLEPISGSLEFISCLSRTYNKLKAIAGYYSYVQMTGTPLAAQTEYAQRRHELCLQAMRKYEQEYLVNVRNTVGQETLSITRNFLGAVEAQGAKSFTDYQESYQRRVELYNEDPYDGRSYEDPYFGDPDCMRTSPQESYNKLFPEARAACLLYDHADQLLDICDMVMDLPETVQMLVGFAVESLRLTIAYSYLFIKTILNRKGKKEGGLSADFVRRELESFKYHTLTYKVAPVVNRLSDVAITNEFNTLLQHLNSSIESLPAPRKTKKRTTVFIRPKSQKRKKGKIIWLVLLIAALIYAILFVVLPCLGVGCAGFLYH